jgi:hypothetical protein
MPPREAEFGEDDERDFETETAPEPQRVRIKLPSPEPTVPREPEPPSDEAPADVPTTEPPASSLDPVSTQPPAPPFTGRPQPAGPGQFPPARSPFGPAPSESPEPVVGVEREGPHTGILMLAINVLIVLIVVVVVLMPRNGKTSAGASDGGTEPAVPAVPDWPSIPEPDVTPVVSEEASAEVEKVVTSLLGLLARNDLLGAVRWIVPTEEVPREVADRLAPLTVGLKGRTNVAWRLLAPMSATPEGLSVVVRVGGGEGRRLELDFQDTSLGWRVARLQWSGATNEVPVELDFSEPSP